MVQPLERTLARMGSDEGVKLIIALDKSGMEASVVLRRDAAQEDILEAYVRGYLLLHSTSSVVTTSSESAIVRNRVYLYSAQCVCPLRWLTSHDMCRIIGEGMWMTGWQTSGQLIERCWRELGGP